MNLGTLTVRRPGGHRQPHAKLHGGGHESQADRRHDDTWAGGGNVMKPRIFVRLAEPGGPVGRPRPRQVGHSIRRRGGPGGLPAQPSEDAGPAAAPGGGRGRDQARDGVPGRGHRLLHDLRLETGADVCLALLAGLPRAGRARRGLHGRSAAPPARQLPAGEAAAVLLRAGPSRGQTRPIDAASPPRCVMLPRLRELLAVRRVRRQVGLPHALNATDDDFAASAQSSRSPSAPSSRSMQDRAARPHGMIDWSATDDLATSGRNT